MVVLGINNKDYRVFDSFSEVTVKKARDLYRLAVSAPKELLSLYEEQAKGKAIEGKIQEEFFDSLGKIQDDLDQFFFKVLELLSDIPSEVIDNINKDDLRACYNVYLYKFVFGVLHFPLDECEIYSDFHLMGETYYLPSNRTVMGFDRPFCDEKAGVFCDASDVNNNSIGSKYGKYGSAELLTAIMYRKKGDDYSGDDYLDVAESYKDILTCDIYHSALKKLSEVNNALSILFPNLYQKGNVKVKKASKQSGLSGFGWLNSIVVVAEKGILNKEGLTPLDSVKHTNLYDVMTILSNMRANTDFERVYKENNK